jgi:hypothetical protein
MPMQRHQPRHQEDLAAGAREIIDANRYLTLAGADDDGRPWAAPVWYAHRATPTSSGSAPRVPTVYPRAPVPSGHRRGHAVPVSVSVRSVPRISAASWTSASSTRRRAAREVERIRTASVIGDKPRRDSRRYERRLGEFRFASRGVGADLDHGTTPRGGALR